MLSAGSAEQAQRERDNGEAVTGGRPRLALKIQAVELAEDFTTSPRP